LADIVKVYLANLEQSLNTDASERHAASIFTAEVIGVYVYVEVIRARMWFECVSVLQGMWQIKDTRRGQGIEISVLWP
jgi:hypothetical protein